MAKIITKIDQLVLDEYALNRLVAFIPDGAIIEQVKHLLEMKAQLEDLGCRVDISLRRLRYIHNLKVPPGFQAVNFDLYEGYNPPRCRKCHAVAIIGRALPDPNPATTETEYQCFNGHRWSEQKVWD